MAAAAPAPAGDVGDMTSKDYYFDSYAHFGIHEEMLKDTVRTTSYRDAIVNNPHLFKDKIVLDVGCGTGVLSMFAAQAGAAHVIAVECSGIALKAREIIAANGFADTITVVQGKIEEIDLPDGFDHVDIIISEWMGYFLLYESMLNSVLFARDKWLSPGGLLFPDKAEMYICGIEDLDYRRQKLDFWDSVYGFDMSCIKHLAIVEPLVDVVEPSSVWSDSAPLLSLDLNTCTVEDLAFTRTFTITAQRNDFCHALVAYFDTTFSACHTPVVLDTSPFSEYTHWKQTVFYLEDTFPVHKGESFTATMKAAPNGSNPRDFDIDINYTFASEKSDVAVSRQQAFRLR